LHLEYRQIAADRDLDQAPAYHTGGIDMSRRNGFSELAKLVFRYEGQLEQLKQVLSEKYPQETLINLLNHEMALTRRAAVYALGFIGDMDAVPPLAESLKHPDSGTRFNAEQALWEVWFRSGDAAVDAKLQEGMNEIKKERYEAAIEILTGVIVNAPNFAEGYNQRAIAHFFLEAWRKSIEDCDKTIELNPYHFGAYAGMGHSYLKLSDLQEALNAYQKALEINPNLFGIAQTLLQIQEALRRHFGDE
jgi:tetratricopeptide (TPR) repeat protein